MNPLGLIQCLTNATLSPAACPAGARCCVAEYFKSEGCVFAGGTRCCPPGPALEASRTLPNCLVIGDSVSEQYTPLVAKMLAGKCQVQHAPHVGGGSANNAGSGLANLRDCRWLRSAPRPDLPVKWDVILFNFGLHDLPKAADPVQLDLYQAQLDNITQLLVDSGARHVVYASTTPYEAEALPSCGAFCDAPKAAEYPQPRNGGNGRCGPPACEAGAPGCGVGAPPSALPPRPAEFGLRCQTRRQRLWGRTRRRPAAAPRRSP